MDIVIEAAKKAGRVIINGYSHQNSIDTKENSSLVTEIDKNAEKVIIETLEQGSSYKILAEETKNELVDESIYWAVDPLDGTTNFIRRIPLFVVSIALIENNKPTIGVIYNPVSGELFTAEKGKGAFLNGVPINCSSDTKLLFANNGYSTKNKEKFAELIAKTTKYSIRKLGSTAYELALVANGNSDAFIAWGDEIWDHAAGILLVRESGGIVTDWQGEDWNTRTNYVLASNREIHPELLSVVRHIA